MTMATSTLCCTPCRCVAKSLQTEHRERDNPGNHKHDTNTRREKILSPRTLLSRRTAPETAPKTCFDRPGESKLAPTARTPGCAVWTRAQIKNKATRETKKVKDNKFPSRFLIACSLTCLLVTHVSVHLEKYVRRSAYLDDA